MARQLFVSFMKIEQLVANFFVPNPTFHINLRPYFLDIFQLLFDQILKFISLNDLFRVQFSVFWSVQITTLNGLFVGADICLPLDHLRLLLLLLLLVLLMW